VGRVKEANFFAILADEVAYISNTEQMNILLRYVDKNCEIQEEFLAFSTCRSGEALASNILSTLQSHGLDVKFVRGQGYDGAGTMEAQLVAQLRGFKPSSLKLCTHIAIHIS